MQGGHDVPIPKIVKRYYLSIQQCIEIIPYVHRLDVFDNSRDGGDWIRLFKFGPDRKLTLLIDSPINIPE